MQSSPYHTSYLQQPGCTVYRSIPAFHHGSYYADTTTDAATFYHNYVSSAGSVTVPVYQSTALPSFAESTPSATSSFYHPGFPHASRCADYNNGSAVSSACDTTANFSSLKCSDRLGNSNDNGMHQNGVWRTGGKLQAADCDGSNGEGEAGHAVDYNTYVAYSDKNIYPQPQSYPHHPSQILQPSELPMLSEHSDQKPNELNEQVARADPKPLHDYSTCPSGDTSEQHNHLLQKHNNDHDGLSQSPVNNKPDRHPRSASEESSEERSEKASASVDSEGKSTTNNTSPPHQKAETESQPGRDSNDVKPTLSYIALIAKSILESPHRRLNLGSIYGWIEHNFPYYKGHGQGWRNSVRHNLSLNDCFIKAGRCEDGKGNYWAIHPANLHDFLRGDFRQRRRSRRRGRKNSELGLYPHTYLGSSQIPATAVAPAQMTFPPSSAANLSSLYYTESDRKAYRLDEALHRQSTGTSLYKWYHPCSTYPCATAPSPVTSDVYSEEDVAGVTGVGTSTSQWPEAYNFMDSNCQGNRPRSYSYSRNYATPAIV